MIAGGMKAEPVTLGELLQVAFERKHDRFHHTVTTQLPSGAVTLLTSQEGRGQEFWPASPALQQLSIVELGEGRRAALLIGMAGRSHWSLSVVAEANGRELLFDAACRVQQAPSQLGSSYRVLVPATLGSGPSVLLGGDALGRPAVCESDEKCRILADGSCLFFQCSPSTESLPATFRWSYRITLQ